ncbi:hypothetical protein CYMTET_14724 [Cymbomonas tetramitiformis]|uniref:Helicase ATP-binding domain-containing protein n=1 Tax=Cymbomonas tetramitiformis TaxID=36881 RepID=A0AAE0GFX6_9CHLO|nr:hypothetical protein CYMTET_14724 [Cymbomonas tetramitiformis]
MYGLRQDYSAAFQIPYLPEGAPQAEQPAAVRLPLYPHQLRSLYRMQQVERDGTFVGGFNTFLDYKSRGGVLADAIGMGKTATMLALMCSEAKDQHGSGPNLVVAPSHLLQQWAVEAERFAGSELQVVRGREGFETVAAQGGLSNKVLVLVDVADVLTAPRVWYDFRRAFKAQDKKEEIRLSVDTRNLYRCAATFVSGGYTGWVYTDPLHLPPRCWRRIIFDEIQDLVREGSESQDNFVQLTRECKNVWLVTATPFPMGNSSVYANHQLLGFHRLRLSCEQGQRQSADSPFEIIKRKLYVRNPEHVRQKAVTSVISVLPHVVQVSPLAVEQAFYESETAAIPAAVSKWDATYETVRQMCCHPAASRAFRDAVGDEGEGKKSALKFSRASMEKLGSKVLVHKRQQRTRLADDVAQLLVAMAKTRNGVAVVSRAVELDAQRELASARCAWQSLGVVEGPSAPGGPESAEGAEGLEERCASAETIPQAAELAGLRCMTEVQMSQLCDGGEIAIRIIVAAEEAEAGGGWGRRGEYVEQDRFLEGYEAVNAYLEKLGDEGQRQHYLSVQRRTLQEKQKRTEAKQRKISQLDGAILRLRALSESSPAPAGPVDDLALRYGSKPAALVRFLRETLSQASPAPKVIVFSMWDDALHIFSATLGECGIPNVFCEGTAAVRQARLSQFVEGEVNVLMLSSRVSASGTNLQVATEVVLIDPQIFWLWRLIGAASYWTQLEDDGGNYTCEGCHNALPPALVPAPAPAASEVEVTGALSCEEREKQKWDNAFAEGRVIDIGDEEDIGTEMIDLTDDSQPHAVVLHQRQMTWRAQFNDNSDGFSELNLKKRTRGDEKDKEHGLGVEHGDDQQYLVKRMKVDA